MPTEPTISFSATRINNHYRATPIRGSTKYGQNNPWKKRFTNNLSDEEEKQLGWLSGHSIAKNTWRTYDTASNLFRWFCKEKNIPPTLPASEETITRFVLWLSFTRKVSHATISVYLAGLRQLHLQHGVECVALRSEYTKMLLKGKKNSESSSNTQAGRRRQPATPEIMERLRAKLLQSDIPAYEKRLVWTVSTILFFGALRSSEILCTRPDYFDPRFCACAGDIRLVTRGETSAEKLEVTIKSPKESKDGSDVTIEIFPAKNPQICTVTSWKKWVAWHPPTEINKPVFRHESSVPFTQADLNKLLAELLPGLNISSHSFRIGAATAMGQLGFCDNDIKLTGRWRSNAFELYVRKGKARRSAVSADFSNRL